MVKENRIVKIVYCSPFISCVEHLVVVVAVKVSMGITTKYKREV